jgi:hypothetical protein
MLIRIFLFGLIAIARGPQEATVLVLQQAGHYPYVAFDKASCASVANCPTAPVLKTTIYGFTLNQNKILLSPVTDPLQNMLSFAGGRRDYKETVPQDATEAADFSWVASIPTILRPLKGSGKATDNCLNSPQICDHPLSAHMKLTLGTLQTCRLIETSGGIFGSTAIFGFDFSQNISSKSNLKQAMASIVELVAVLDDKPVTLQLKTFGGRDAGQVLLKSVPCVDPRGNRCIDLFVGNITEEDLGDPLGQYEALHFAEYFGLLADSEKLLKHQAYLFDTKSKDNQADPVRVQPQCRTDLPLIPLTRAPRFASPLFTILDAPLSRPLCPPGGLAY